MAAVRVLAIVAGIALVLLALLWIFQRSLIYLPDSGAAAAAGDVLPGARDVTLSTSDGLRLGAYHVSAADGRRDVTVLIAGGNGGNREGRATTAAALSDAGFDVLLLDYRGYGGNPGSPSEDGLALDVRAAFAFLVEDAGVRPDRLLYFGESLGAGVVAELATEHPPAGLLLRSPFPSLAAVGQRHYPIVPVGLLLRDRYPVTEHVANIRVPITVVYGSADSIVPPALSREVAAAAAEVEMVEVTGAGHNDPVLFHGDELVAAMEQLADRSVTPAGP